MRSILLLLLTAILAAADPKSGAEGTPEHAKAADLVRQLGHPRFPVREAAAKQLSEMGEAALPALAAGTKADDEEVRTRSAALLPKVRTGVWKKRADDYLADADGKRKHDLPLLGEYEKVVGKPDAGARRLFAEMVRSSGELLHQAAADPPAAVRAVQARCGVLASQLGTDQKQLSAEVGELAALFFVHARASQERSDWRRNDHPAHLLPNPGLADGLASADLGPPLRRLVAHWADTRPANDLSSHQFFALAVRHRPFPEAVPVLARLARDPNASPLNVRALAIEALGRVGDKEAKAALGAMMGDSTALLRGVGGGQQEYRVGDFAFAALVEAHKKNPTDYGMTSGLSIGFRFAAQRDIVRLDLRTFPSDEARQKGLKKWKDETGVK